MELGDMRNTTETIVSEPEREGTLDILVACAWSKIPQLRAKCGERYQVMSQIVQTLTVLTEIYYIF